MSFTHLHVHSQYSILDGAANLKRLLARAKELGMNSIAVTDHGNMYGAMEFFAEAKKAGVKPILGCEVYLARNGRKSMSDRTDRSGNHLILLAKNKVGYKNLVRLVSIGHTEGFYYTPRIDKDDLRKYSEGIIASSACLGGELPQAVMKSSKEKAAELVQEYKEIFGDDYYIEIQRHGLPEQEEVNKVLVELAEEHDVKILATNDVHFIHKEDYDAHKILICLNTNSDIDDMGDLHYTGNEYLKSPEEISQLYHDLPEAVANTQLVSEKCEEYDIRSDVILPIFPLPEGYESEDDYLRHLTYEGAKKRYGEITEEIKDRLELELDVFRTKQFSGYFLIVADFINEARKMKVLVGPGRGSAAGSAVAFCIGITNIDPIKYTLLFERFLNPERVSMPDVDVDFDDEGRERVIDYVEKKYGRDQVAQIVTFGTMAAKTSIRDVARVLKLPLPDADRLAKLVPEKPGITLKKAYSEVPELKAARNKGDELIKKTLTYAETLEGSARHTGLHACGVIIGPDALINHVPLCKAKDSNLFVTQYEGKYIEGAGMLKMDFLGLRTLSIIKDAIVNIQERHGVEINIDTIPLDDEKTFSLYQKGDTVGTFQFESEGMRTYLRELKPTDIEDLIAMNALYRPGPMSYIPTFIDRKQGKQKVVYPDPMLEGILSPTYGIMVYQEQIMQAAQIMGGFSLGKADELRRAMGKKKMDVMEEQKEVFLQGAKEKGIEADKALKVFNTMAKFAEYGFNRSHSAAYSVVAYQTAYLKAHYPAEYMAAVLTHNLNDIKKITFFIDESRRQKIPVLGPDVNESSLKFTVNSKAEIRFGLGAVKGVGEAAAIAVIDERKENGPFKSVFDLVKRVNLRTVNKRSIEALAQAGAFDEFGEIHRAQYFHQAPSDDQPFIEKLVRHGNLFQDRQQAMQHSLFGGGDEMEITDPIVPDCEPWSELEQLKKEKDVIGFYISGHPLDMYELEMKHFAKVTLEYLKNNLSRFKDREISVGGMVIDAQHRTTKKGDPFGSFVLEDYTDSFSFFLFKESYLKYKHLLVEGSFVQARVKVQLRYKSEDQLETRLQNMMLLSEVLEKQASELTLQLNLDDLTPQLLAGVKKAAAENPGKCKLRFRIIGGEEGLLLEMPSRTFRVNPTDMVREIKEFGNVRYSIS